MMEKFTKATNLLIKKEQRLASTGEVKKTPLFLWYYFNFSFEY